MSTIEVTHEAKVWDWPLQSNDGVVKVTTLHDAVTGMGHYHSKRRAESACGLVGGCQYLAVVNTNDKFEVGLDAQFFSPKEIEVKVCGQDLLIHCRHELRPDEHGTVAREVHRAYKLPQDVDVSTVKSHLTNRGVLNITASKQRK